MAFYEEDNEDQQDPNAPAPVQTSGQSAVIDGQGASSQAAQAQATSAPDKSGNFVGIKQYLDANKNQSAKLGDQVSGQIQNTIQGAQTEVSGLNDKFQGLANQGQISDIGNAAAQAQSVTGKAATQAAGQGLNDQEKNRFKEVANAQYKGPNTLVETDIYQPAAAKVSQAQNYANLSKNESGSQQLLRDVYKSPNYSAGENRLDSYLLNSQDNRQKLEQSRKGAEGLTGSLTSAEDYAAQYAQQQKALADSIRQATQKNLVDTQTNRNQSVQAELDAISKDWRSEYDSYLNLLKNSNGGQNLALNDEQAKKLGVEKGQRIFNILNPSAGNTPEQYLSLQEFDPNKVISKDQQSQLAALDELAGTFGGALQNKYTQKDLAGTLNKSDAFSAGKFGDSAKLAQEQFDTAAKTAKIQSKVDKNGATFNEISFDVPVPYMKEVVISDNPITGRQVAHVPDIRMERRTERLKSADVTGSATIASTIAEYLAGAAPQRGLGGSKTATGEGFLPGAAAPILSVPMALDQDFAADRDISGLQQQAEAEAKQNWTNQILDYLKSAGYNNRVV